MAKEESEQGGGRGPNLLPVFFPQGLHSEDSVLIMVRVQAGTPEHAGKMPSSRLSRFCDGHLLPKKKKEKKIQITKVFLKQHIAYSGTGLQRDEWLEQRSEKVSVRTEAG